MNQPAALIGCGQVPVGRLGPEARPSATDDRRGGGTCRDITYGRGGGGDEGWWRGGTGVRAGKGAPRRHSATPALWYGRTRNNSPKLQQVTDDLLKVK